MQRIPARDMFELRRLAEEHVGPRQAAKPRSTYEVEVLQRALELQHQELQNVRSDLDTTRRRYDDLYESAPLGFVVIDTFGRITEGNRRLGELLAVHRTELLGTALAHFMSDDDAELLDRNLRATTATEPRTVDTHFVRPDGEVVPVRLDIVVADESSYRVAITTRSVVRGIDEVLAILISTLGSIDMEIAGGREALDRISGALARGRATLAKLRAERTMFVSLGSPGAEANR